MFKKDDIVVSLTGYTSNWGSTKYGGAAYRENLLIKVSRLNTNGDDCVFSDDLHHGIFCYAIRLATSNEIIAYNNGIRNIENIKEFNYEIY